LSADGRFHNDSLFNLPTSFFNSPTHYFYVSTLFFNFCLYLPSFTFPLLCFLLHAIICSFVLPFFLPSFFYLRNFCLHTYFMFLLPHLPFVLPSCISLFPRCSLLSSVYFAVLRRFFLTLVLLFLFPPDGDALALLFVNSR
jgi:hypothetical protein